MFYELWIYDHVPTIKTNAVRETIIFIFLYFILNGPNTEILTGNIIKIEIISCRNQKLITI